jgi:CRP-like cAMP-binding protein
MNNPSHTVSAKHFLKSLPMPLLEHFSGNISLKILKPRQILMKEGDIDGNVYIIQSGFMKAYFECDGKKNITHFFTKDDCLSTIPTLFNEGNAWITIEALTETHLLYVSRDAILEGFKKDPALYFAFLEGIRIMSLEHQTKLGHMIFRSAAEHYLDFLDHIGDDIKYLTQKDIASYLNIKHETLSRLRNKRMNVSSNTGKRA